MMKKILTTFSAAILSVSMATPLAAAPVMKPVVPEAGNLVQDVQYRRWRDAYEYRPRARMDNDRWHRDRWDRRNYRRGDARYYRGYRGYRNYRPGYREYNGFWFPAAAFLAGSLITGAITGDRDRGVRYGSRHVEWCYDRYRSYRASDNTFQPYNGSRRACNSPYN